MAWKLQTLKAPIPADDIEAIMTPLDAAVSSISGILDVVAEALEVIAVFANPSTDPYNLIIQGFYDELNAFINNFFATGVYSLTVSPFNVSGNLRHDAFSIPILYPQDAIEAAVKSLDDPGDAARPQFSDSAEVAAVGFMVTATSAPGLEAIIRALTEIFRVPAWEFALREIQRRMQVAVKSTQPDWVSIRLNSVDQMAQLQGALISNLEVLRGYTTIPDNNLNDLVSAIQTKVSSLESVIQEVRDVVSLLTRSVGGVYVLNLPAGVGGNARIKAALRDAYLENCKPTSGYTIMTLLVGGGPSLQTVETIRALMT